MTISKRLIEFADKQEFLCDWKNTDSNWHIFSFDDENKPIQAAIRWVDIKNSSKMSLNLAMNTDLQQIDRAYLEAFCHLSQSLNMVKIDLISFRDLENFLRDENHIEAHPKDLEHDINAIKWLDSIKKELSKPLYSHLFDAILVKFTNLHESEQFLEAIKDINTALSKQVRMPSMISESEIIAVIPMSVDPLQYELQWRFSPSIESEGAQDLCFSLEKSLRNNGVSAKVVAEY